MSKPKTWASKLKYRRANQPVEPRKHFVAQLELGVDFRFRSALRVLGHKKNCRPCWIWAMESASVAYLVLCRENIRRPFYILGHEIVFRGLCSSCATKIVVAHTPFWAGIAFFVAHGLLGQQNLGRHFFLICGPLTCSCPWGQTHGGAIWVVCLTTTVSNIVPAFAYQCHLFWDPFYSTNT